MAFTLPLTINGELQAAAYIKATVAYADATKLVVKLTVWTSQASRTNGGEPVPSNYYKPVACFPKLLGKLIK